MEPVEAVVVGVERYHHYLHRRPLIHLHHQFLRHLYHRLPYRLSAVVMAEVSASAQAVAVAAESIPMPMAEY